MSERGASRGPVDDRLEERLQVLRRAPAEELLERVREWSVELGVPEARQVLRNPFVTREVIAVLLEQRRLLNSFELRRELAAHPRTPQLAAQRLIPSLPWRDLANIGRDMQVHPQVRRSADLQLAGRLPGLSLGERISLARIAGHGVLQRLRHDGEPRVIAAMLENPRVTEGLLQPILRSDSTPPDVLRLIADSPRWRVRYGVRAALCRNPRMPETRSYGWLSGLRPDDLRAVVRDPRLSPRVRGRASKLLGGGSVGLPEN